MLPMLAVGAGSECPAYSRLSRVCSADFCSFSPLRKANKQIKCYKNVIF